MGLTFSAPSRRLWLIFFSDGHGPGWWKPFLKPGFRHVSAASYYADQERWLYVDPTFRGLEIEMWKPDEFGQRLGQLIRDSHAILRIPSAEDRTLPPLSWWCVGTIKSLLGVRTGALSPWQLYSHLLGIGAESVEVERPDGKTVQDAECAGGAD